MYTNTSNWKAIVGLIVVTVAVSYVSANSTQIVNGAIALAKDGVEFAKAKIHSNKKQYIVCAKDIDGKVYDTGQRIWK